MRLGVTMLAVVCLLAGKAAAQVDPSAPTAATPSLDAPGSGSAEPTAAPDDATSAPEEPGAQLGAASATPAADAASVPDSSFVDGFLARIQIHGFVSEGGFVSTDNDFIGSSSRGSLKFFEAAFNISAELTDQLRVGMQFVSRSVGTLSEEVPRVDWALADYHPRQWFGLRAGVIKMPLGLYNEYIAVDAARTAILLPQSVYAIRNRDALFSHAGFAVYGGIPLGSAGVLDYQAWLGTLMIPRSALTVSNATLESTDTKYVTGGQLFWRTPLDGLRFGATYVQASIDFHLTLDATNTSQLIMAGLVPADYRGQLRVSQRPTRWWVVSAEYLYEDWLFAAEYLRGFKHQVTSLPEVIPATDDEGDGFYGMVTYRIARYLEIGAYYSVNYADVNDRRGHSEKFSKPYLAFQRDLAGTVRFDINEYWLWKLEGHFMDGASELPATTNPDPTRYWGLFLLRTTVTF
jgi:hypothetical protein